VQSQFTCDGLCFFETFSQEAGAFLFLLLRLFKSALQFFLASFFYALNDLIA